MAFSHSTLLALLLYETKNNTMLMAFGNANNPSPKRKHTLRTEKKPNGFEKIRFKFRLSSRDFAFSVRHSPIAMG